MKSEYFGLDKYTCPEDYINDGIIPIEPMTAKEVMEKEHDFIMGSDDYIFEEKLDGVRGLVYFMPARPYYNNSHCRVFTRRKSVKTDFYGEKTDSLPHIFKINIPELDGTVLDCEMVVLNKDFKTVSSILNCLPSEAIERQRSEGRVVCKVFDVVRYRGVSQESAPLMERKEMLIDIIRTLHSNGVDCILPVPWGRNKITVFTPHSIKRFSKEEYFHYIMKKNGEGIMVKNVFAAYEQKRTRAYQKVKKRIYRDVVIVGFTAPTKEYNGKFPKDHWNYWVDKNDNKLPFEKAVALSGKGGNVILASKLLKAGYIPVTANYYYDRVGGIKFGVAVDELFLKHKRESKKQFEEVYLFDDVRFVVVGECEGIDDSMRIDMSENPQKWVGSVFEVEGNEMFYDTGKLRHPRFYREREDKKYYDCTWSDHINA